MRVNTLDFSFWAAGLLGHAILFAVLLARGRFRQMPFFSALIATNIVETIALFFIFRADTKMAYSYAYWSFALLEAALKIAVLYEVADSVYRPVGIWARDVRFQIALLACASVVAALGLAWWASPPAKTILGTFVIRGNLFVAVLLSMLFAAILATSSHVGLAWRNHVWQVALGLGVYSMSTFIVEGMHSYLGVVGHEAAYKVLSRVRIALYLGLLCYWIQMLWLDEPKRRPVTPAMRASLFALRSQLARAQTELNSSQDQP
jgi:hypothetical protein